MERLDFDIEQYFRNKEALGRREVERKALRIDQAALEAKLESLGSRIVFDGSVLSEYYSGPPSDLFKDFREEEVIAAISRERNDYWARLRMIQEGDRVLYFAETRYRLVGDDAETQFEEPGGLVEPEKFEAIKRDYKTLGLRLKDRELKKRKIIVLPGENSGEYYKGLEYAIDTIVAPVSTIPTYLEIEAISMEVFSIGMQKIGFSLNDLTNISARRLIEQALASTSTTNS